MKSAPKSTVINRNSLIRASTVTLVFIDDITFKLKTYNCFVFLSFFLIWCRSGEIRVGQADFPSPPDRLSCKVWETFVNSGFEATYVIGFGM